MTTQQHHLLLGAHMCIAGGLQKTIERGESIGCTAIQIFLKSNRQWAGKHLSEQEIEAFKAAKKQSTIRSYMAHATYLINLGAADAALNKKSLAAVDDELNRCNLLDIPYLIVHPGSAVGSTEQDALKRIADNLNEVFTHNKGSAMLLLENMAGQGTALCSKFEHLAYLYEQSEFKKRLGICFDTCHAFAAGYDFRDGASYKKLWQTFDDIIGLKHLKAIHVNDSKKELGSRVDRHEDIGKGKICLQAFELLFNDERFFDIPKVLETPKEENSLADDARNMAVIREVLHENTQKKLGLL